MNPEHRGNESKTSNRQTKASLPARKTCLFLFFFFFFFLGGKDIHACFCPPTKHDTKLDQLNKAKEKQGPLKESQTTLVRAATAATGSATTASAATPAASFRQRCQQ